MLTITEAAAAAGLSERQMRHLCSLGRVRGARKAGPRVWLIAEDFEIMGPPYRPRGRPPRKDE